VLPAWVVTGIAHVPGGAWPSYARGYYPRDNAFYIKWDAISRDRARFTDWIDRHVRATLDHAGFLRSLATADAA
jgi:glutaconate CoA-transferase subunit A